MRMLYDVMFEFYLTISHTPNGFMRQGVGHTVIAAFAGRLYLVASLRLNSQISHMQAIWMIGFDFEAHS
jgi:hypothetical protein